MYLVQLSHLKDKPNLKKKQFQDIVSKLPKRYLEQMDLSLLN